MPPLLDSKNNIEAKKQVISFPNLAEYSLPIKILLNNIFDNCEIRCAPPTSKKTLEAGARHSPDFVCLPFKYNLGNMIESLENGANILMQAGGGCRFGYYAEVQEQILKDLGYDFEFLYMFNSDKLSYMHFYRMCKGINPKLTFRKFAYFALLTLRIIKKMDLCDFYIRKNIGFETEENSFINWRARFFDEISKIKSFYSFNRVFRKYDAELFRIKIEKPRDCLKVGLVGELYTLMDSSSNFSLERRLAKAGISLYRYTNLTYLVLEKKTVDPKLIRQTRGCLKYEIGADGTESVAHTVDLAEKNFDGMIHIKPFGCSPEINAMPVLQRISGDYGIPVVYLSVDAQTGEAGINTRLEAFIDMVKMRKKAREQERFLITEH